MEEAVHQQRWLLSWSWRCTSVHRVFGIAVGQLQTNEAVGLPVSPHWQCLGCVTIEKKKLRVRQVGIRRVDKAHFYSSHYHKAFAQPEFTDHEDVPVDKHYHLTNSTTARCVTRYHSWVYGVLGSRCVAPSLATSLYLSVLCTNFPWCGVTLSIFACTIGFSSLADKPAADLPCLLRGLTNDQKGVVPPRSISRGAERRHARSLDDPVLDGSHYVQSSL